MRHPINNVVQRAQVSGPVLVVRKVAGSTGTDMRGIVFAGFYNLLGKPTERQIVKGHGALNDFCALVSCSRPTPLSAPAVRG